MALLAVAIAAAVLCVCWVPCALVTGSALRLEVQRAQVGYFRVFGFEVGGVDVGIGLPPVNSWVKFKGSDSAPADDPDPVNRAGPGRRDWLALPPRRPKAYLGE